MAHNKHDKSRPFGQIRPIKVSYNSFGYAPGKVLFELGNTKVLCCVTMQNGVPHFLKGTKTGWLTAEYSLLPTSTYYRASREISSGKRNSRAVEISRLIGRSFRSIVNTQKIGERTITIDCDVLQADGGTRTACITGAYLALKQAESKWLACQKIEEPFIKEAIAAISVGVVDGIVCCDLDYAQDSKAQADFNFVLTEQGNIVEIQGCSEQAPISHVQFAEIQKIAVQGIKDVFLSCKKSSFQKGKQVERQPAFFSLARRNISVSE